MDLEAHMRNTGCPGCNAGGQFPDGHHDCRNCNGSGHVADPDAPPLYPCGETVHCPHCDGTGETPRFESACQYCGGSGTAEPACLE